MADKNIKNFLPSVFRTNKIKNFMDSTTETLFNDQNSENKSYFVGRKAGGLFDPMNDYYAQERSKIRDDYQLEPTLIVRDKNTSEVTNALFYEDLLNTLNNNGSFTEDHDRLFRSDAYSFAPPIDADMFINYSDYYWYPEGAPSVECDAVTEDVEGLIEATLRVKTTNQALTLSSGHHIVLNDGVEYIVEGVGRYINLIEFSRTVNKPVRIDRIIADTADVDELIEQFPAEYVSMDRGALDQNPWSRNNSWYHKDVLTGVFGNTTFSADRTRRAQRPIICFKRDIELYNYGKHLAFVSYFGEVGNEPSDLVAGDLVAYNGDATIYEYVVGDSFVTSTVTAEHSDKITITAGPNKADEYRWDEFSASWVMCQRKVEATQKILFNLYDSNEATNATALDNMFTYPQSTFSGTTIFSYGIDEDGLEDPVLGFPPKYKAFKESSDIVFESSMGNAYTYQGVDGITTTPNGFYKTQNPARIDSNNVLRFTIVKGTSGEAEVYINDESSQNLVLKANTQYRLDFSDSSTTARGWSNGYSPITIHDENGDEVVKPTHADSAKNRVLVTFNQTSDDKFYTYKTNGFEGKIFVVGETVSGVDFGNGWALSGNLGITLKEEEVFGEGDAPALTLGYIPKNDRLNVIFNGDQVEPKGYSFEDNTVTLIGVRETERGDYMEVFYSTHERIKADTDTVQRVYGALNNNPFNGDEESFAFSEIFDQFRSIIRNQPYIKGTALTDNNFRDTLKNGAYGDVFQRHSNPIVPLMFMNNDKNIDMVRAMLYAKDSYNAFKTSILSRVEDFLRDTEINNENVRDIFDSIVTGINSGRNKNDSFAYSYMFATYNKYTNVSFDHNGIANIYMDLSDESNEFYVYTSTGLKLIDIDYRLVNDIQTRETRLEPITFALGDIQAARYYEDMEPSFCPATPMKFGLDKPKKPEIKKDGTYLSDRHFIIGHDGSATLAFSTNEDIEKGIIDGRDLVLLEFEKRVYNGIASEFKSEENYLIDLTRITPSNYNQNRYTKDEIRDTEFAFFHKWTYDNNINYTSNSLYRSDDIRTYNFTSFDSEVGDVVSGHWKAIFEYYYGTTTPHETPWEILSFRIKPAWWDGEYGTEYSSNNTAMWGDLEDGIVRHGNRKNVDFLEYKSSHNRLRKEGLSNILPVDVDGNLRTITDIGLADEDTLDYRLNKRNWSFGEFGTVEQSWRGSSDYCFVRQIVFYILNPLEYVAKAWDTNYSINLGPEQVHVPQDLKIHSFVEGSSSFTYVPGITQWVYGYLQNKNLSGEAFMRDAYANTDVVLAHKIGGYIDSTNLTVTTETFNPRSGNTVTTIPEEDISVLQHESKDIAVESYSGVLVERVSAEKEYYNFISGELYDLNDVIFNSHDGNYYKLTSRLRDYVEWGIGYNYVPGRVAIYGGKLYVCIVAHQADESALPTESQYWNLREFVGTDWALLTGKPKSKTTYFKVYGYDMYDSEFLTIPPSTSSRIIDVESATSETKQIAIVKWEPNKFFAKGQYSRLGGQQVYVCIRDHTSGDSIDAKLWQRADNVPQTGLASVSVKIDGNSSRVQHIPYGTVFRSETEVANFLLAYGRYLESRGWVFDSFDKTRNRYKNWLLSVEEFIQWAYENKAENNVIGLSPISEDIKFSTKHGVASITRDRVKRDVSLTDDRGRILDIEQCEFNRLGGVLTVSTPVPVYYCKVTVKEYEHAIAFNNKTVFNDVIYEPVLGIRKDRLKIRTIKTLGWDGRLYAQGFIISGNKLLPNFETSVKDLTTIASQDTLSVQDSYNRLKFHNYGYERRSYLEDLGLDDRAQIGFYSGFIRQKGSAESFQRLLRSSQLDVSENMDINEEWAFREGRFGGIANNQYIEFAFDRKTIKSSPQLVQLEYLQEFQNKKATDVYVNIDDRSVWLSKPTMFAENDKLWVEKPLRELSKVPTAGYVKWSDADYKAFGLNTLAARIKETNKVVATGQRAWIAKDTSEAYGWNVFESQSTEFVIDEIITHGRDNISSMILRLSGNVSEEHVYGLYINTHDHTFRFKKLKADDNVYIALSYDTEDYIVLDSTLTATSVQNLGFIRWVPTRINSRYNEVFPDVINTIDTFLSNNSIAPQSGQRLYIDDTIGDMSYKEIIIADLPVEYWTFDSYENQQYIGVNGGVLEPQNASAIVPNDTGVLGTLGTQSSDSFDPVTSEWPDAMWASLGVDTSSTNKVFEVWMEHVGDLDFGDSVKTHTIGGFVHVNETTGDYASVQVGIHPQYEGEEAGHRVMYVLNGALVHSTKIKLEDGFDHIVFEYTNGSTGVSLKIVQNGTVVEVVDGLDGLDHTADYNLYVVAVDDAPSNSTMPIIDEMAIYHSMGLATIQNHHDAGKNGLFVGENLQEWGVYEYNGSNWSLVYKEQKVVDTNLLSDVLLYDSNTNRAMGNVNVNDPVKGYFAGSMIDEVDYITEYDPAVYNSSTGNYSKWGSAFKGAVWWDTSTMRYIEYENGSVDERSNFWGTLFPESRIDVYEWVESTTVPPDYDGSGVVYDVTNYVVEDRYDESTLETTRVYYFWVRNTSSIPSNIERDVSVTNISNSIQFPENNGVPFIEILSNEAFVLNDINNQIIQNDVSVQINYTLDKKSPQIHSQWKLVSEDASEDEIPSFIFDKMIDSIVGFEAFDDIGDAVAIPDMNLPVINRYGNGPSQGWFENINNARKNFVQVINEALRDLHIWDIELFWEEGYEEIFRDSTSYGLVDWFKDGYDPRTIVSNLVKRRADILTLPLEDGEFVKVNEKVGRMPSVYEGGYTVYRYLKDYNTYEKVAQYRSAIQFKDSFFDDTIDAEESKKVRLILDVIFNKMLVSDYSTRINGIFFAMVRYVLSEQPANDWVFPSTYINVNQESRSLVKKRVYQSDKEEQLIDYITESKPFHTKLRTIKKIHTGDVEHNGFYVTDFDKPPFLTEARDILILQEELIDTIPYRKDRYYSLAIEKSLPEEHWAMNGAEFGIEAIVGAYGTDMNTATDGGTFAVEKSGVSFSTGFRLNGAFVSEKVMIPSSKMAIEGWFEAPDTSPNPSDVVLTWDIENANVSNDKATVSVYMDYTNGSACYIKAERNGVQYLNEVIDVNMNQMNYLVINVNASKASNVLSVVVNSTPPIGYEIGDMLTVSSSNTSIVAIGNDASNLYDEFAVYARNLSESEVARHYSAASETAPQTIFDLDNVHSNIKRGVYIEGVALPNSAYSITDTALFLKAEPSRAVNHVSNIVVKSQDVREQQILSGYDQARGYSSVSKSNLREWMSTVNQKRTHVMFDRVSLIPSLNLEELVERYYEVQEAVEPLKAFSDQSYKFKGYHGRKFTETDRIATHMYFDDLVEVVDMSYNETVSSPLKKNFLIGTEYGADDILVFVNDQLVVSNRYRVTEDSDGVAVKMKFNVYKNDLFTVRPKVVYESLMGKITDIRGVGTPFHNLDEIKDITFNVSETSTPVRLDGNGDLMIDADYREIIKEDDDQASINVLYSEFDNVGDEVRDSGKFMNHADKGIPEEKSNLNFKEAVVFSFKSNLDIVPRGYETTTPLDIFDSVTFKSNGTETEYPITLNVNPEQVLVLVNEDEWVNTYHYELRSDKIVFLKSLKNKDTVIITDRYSAFDQYRGRQLTTHKNLQTGGFDGDMPKPDFLNDKEDSREFIIYTQDGKVHVFECPESKAVSVEGDVTYNQTTLTLSIMPQDMALVSQDQGKIAAIYAEELDVDGKLVSSKMEFVHYTGTDGNTMTNVQRGLFGKNSKIFDSTKYNITVYPLTIDEELPSFTLIEPYIGVKGRNSYPKYGHIMSGRDS